MMGGWLANPSTTAPGLFPADGLFGRYPYLLPCIASGVLSVIGLVLAFLYVEETLDPKFRSGCCRAGSACVWAPPLDTSMIFPRPTLSLPPFLSLSLCVCVSLSFTAHGSARPTQSPTPLHPTPISARRAHHSATSHKRTRM
jgi:hypothetical protein